MPNFVITGNGRTATCHCTASALSCRPQRRLCSLLRYRRSLSLPKSLSTGESEHDRRMTHG
jgi:hypothetical protein